MKEKCFPPPIGSLKNRRDQFPVVESEKFKEHCSSREKFYLNQKKNYFCCEGEKWSAYTSLLLRERSCLCNSPMFWLLLLVDVAWLVNETWKKSRKTEFSTRRGWKRIINTQNSAPRRCVRVVVCFMIRFREFLGVLEK